MAGGGEGGGPPGPGPWAQIRVAGGRGAGGPGGGGGWRRWLLHTQPSPLGAWVAPSYPTLQGLQSRRC